MQTYKTREEWLLAAIDAVRPLFEEKGHEVSKDCQVSCGFASTGTRSHHIGQCWSKASSSRERNQILITPALHEPVKVLDTMVHELVRAVDNCEHKHGKNFLKIALSSGMVGPMRSAGAGPELKTKHEVIAMVLGPYTHGKLRVVHRSPISRSRLRAKCPTCGFQVPILKRYLAYGSPI